MGYVMTVNEIRNTGSSGLTDNFKGESVIRALAESYVNLSDRLETVGVDKITVAMQTGNKPLPVSNDVGVVASSVRTAGRGDAQHGLS